jgi:putative FmdB family regulatory protein
MPTYEYRCKDCGEHLEVVQSFTDDALTECPACGGNLRKVFGNIGITFKGSGFYKTDSRKAASTSSKSSKSDGGSSDGGSSKSDGGSSDSGSSSSDTSSSKSVSSDGGGSKSDSGSSSGSGSGSSAAPAKTA